ncbi:MAG: polysaccharide biosynthesis tyrosine autokinase [Calothrix sp. MO_167.B42]|nr:polysaccharide biosynthesis tyrosine autokinase [Calothrix sp. MO_167.B42]
MEKGISSLPVVLQRRALPAVVTFSAVIAGAIAYLMVAPRMYETSTRLMLDDKRVSVSEFGRNLTQVSRHFGGPDPASDQAELAKSQPVLERAIAIALPNSNQLTTAALTEALVKDLKVKNIPTTNIIELSYANENPNLAAKMLNAVSQAMLEQNITIIKSEAKKVREFLEKTEVPKARMRWQLAAAAENRYRQKSGIVSFDEQSRSLVESLATLEGQERTLMGQLQEVKSREASLRQITQAGNLGNAYANVRSGQDEELRQLRAKLAETQQKIVEARVTLTDDHPTVTKLLQEQDGLNSLYQKELQRLSPGNQGVPTKDVAADQISQELTSQLVNTEVERVALTNRLKSVQTERVNLQNRLTQLPIKQQPLAKLVREREESAQSLRILQGKLEEARIAEAQKVENLRVIEEARPPLLPTSPQPPLVLVLAGVFGSILAIGVILLLEVMDNTLQDPLETEELVKLPLLGVLPHLPESALVLKPADKFLDKMGFVEPYRMLFKNLEFRSPEKLKLIVVSSTISGEGKSVVASHLAATSAMLSRRTLIIDADLHRPVQHNLFMIDAQMGITDVLHGKNTLQGAVQTTAVENLFILPCGQLYGRPSQMLESEAMRSLLAEAQNSYDCVIVDTSPLSASADAATLGQYSDGLVMVTRPSFTIKEALQRTVSELNKNRIPILGVAVNGITGLRERYYRYPVKGYQPVLEKPVKRLAASGAKESKAESEIDDLRYR